MGGSKNIFKTFLIVGSSSALDQYFLLVFAGRLMQLRLVIVELLPDYPLQFAFLKVDLESSLLSSQKFWGGLVVRDGGGGGFHLG